MGKIVNSFVAQDPMESIEPTKTTVPFMPDF